MIDTSKLVKAIHNLGSALERDSDINDSFSFAAITKLFEVAFEYYWKYFKRLAGEEGVEVFSPRDAVKFAGRKNLIKDIDKWLIFLEKRNLSVHDYISISNEEYFEIIKDFYNEAMKLRL